MRLPLENIADNVRKIALVFIPAGAVGLVVTGDKIIVFEALSMISGGVIIYILSLLIKIISETKSKRIRHQLNSFICSFMIFLSKLFFILAIICTVFYSLCWYLVTIMNILLIVLLLLLAFIFYVIGYAGRIQNNKLAQRRKLKKRTDGFK